MENLSSRKPVPGAKKLGTAALEHRFFERPWEGLLYRVWGRAEGRGRGAEFSQGSMGVLLRSCQVLG